MRTYSAAEARAHLAEVLDLAEAGEPVAGVEFRVEARRRRGAGARTQPMFDILDPAVAEGRWTWAWEGDGLAFTPRTERGVSTL